ncbi:MAG: hypothetical protein ACE5H5_04535, partial [Nitrospinota bacterium]
MRLATVLALVAFVVTGAAAEPSATSLRGAMEVAAQALMADLVTGRPPGKVTSVQGPHDLVARFAGVPPPVDAEYLLVRPPSAAGGGFSRTIGTVRIAEVRGQVGRAVVLWSGADPQPGDRLVWPPRITVVLLPA